MTKEKKVSDEEVVELVDKFCLDLLEQEGNVYFSDLIKKAQNDEENVTQVDIKKYLKKLLLDFYKKWDGDKPEDLNLFLDLSTEWYYEFLINDLEKIVKNVEFSGNREIILSDFFNSPKESYQRLIKLVQKNDPSKIDQNKLYKDVCKKVEELFDKRGFEKTSSSINSLVKKIINKMSTKRESFAEEKESFNEFTNYETWLTFVNSFFEDEGDVESVKNELETEIGTLQGLSKDLLNFSLTKIDWEQLKKSVRK